MSKSKIKEFVSANTVFSKAKLWIPIFFTVMFVVMLIKDYLETTNDFLTLSSYTLFRVIYIIATWAIYYFSKEYAILNGSVFENASIDSSLFDEKNELTFQQMNNKFGVYLLVFILVSVLFEIYRLVYDLIGFSNNFKITVYICLLAISFITFIISLMKSIKLLSFIKLISVIKS